MKDTLLHIGRDVQLNELIINSTTVSASHAQLAYQYNNLILVPLPSSNGIKVNNIVITNPVKLEIGDIVSFGSFVCSYNDLLNTLKIYNYKSEKNPNVKVNITSSVSNSEFKPSQQTTSSDTLNLKKILIYISMVIAVVLLSIAINVLLSQNSSKEEKSKNNVNVQDTTPNDNEKDTENNKKEETSEPKKSSKQSTKIKYNFSCLSSKDDGGSNDLITLFGDITRDIQEDYLANIEVTVEEEMEYGDKALEDMKEKYKVVESGAELTRLNKILSVLKSKLAEPRGFKYQIYFVDDKIKNVFTIGGKIFFFKGMYKMCRNDSEIAAIISHEIGHNELGHLNHTMKKIKASQGFGIFGQIALGVESEITKAFNQKQETHADMFGMDVVFPTSYKTCASIEFWDMMSESEKEDPVNNIFRSHPYSSKRSNCVRNHLSTNYNKTCE